MKKKKGTLLIIFLILIIVGSSLICFKIMDDKKKENEQKNRNEIVKQITSHYNNYVKTNKEAILYSESEEEIGKIGKGVEISLSDIDITYETKYFKIKELGEKYFIKYEDVDKIDSLSEMSDRYKKYIVFNQNVETEKNTKFYDENNNLIYEINESINLPIIVKDNDKYGVEFNNRLLYVKSDNVTNIIENHNTDLNNSSGVAVLNYHAFYDENNAEETANCPTIICHSKSQFKSHLDLINEMGILTVKMDEVEKYIDGKIQLPRSVLITIDDGGREEHAIDMLTEYNMYGTIFLVTSWFNPSEYYVTDNIELHSHSHNMHNTGDCPNGQGGGIQCLDRDKILEDLKTSRSLLNNTTAFCYPFYEYNDYSISVLKEAGFTMSFVGESGDSLVHVGMDKFRLPRFIIVTYTTVDALRNYFNQIY